MNLTENRVPHSGSAEPAHLKLHGDVLLILWRGVALLVVGEVVGRARVDDGGLC